MAASSSSSSLKCKRSYDVFLSFRGTDVRKNFLSHLHTALHQHGFFTYIDSEELRKGEQISPALMKAIEESRIVIIVFSKDYASSPWCLEEVAKIMECKEQRDLLVFPVFYKVDPCEVRTPRESYREAMAKHEIEFGKDSEKVNRWKTALFDAGCLSGWHFTDFTHGCEAGLIQHIVQEISTQLDRLPLCVAKYPVRIESQVQKLRTILNLQSRDDVLMVGLWGRGGIGKTTLAKAIYNIVYREFEGSTFLERVRENSKSSSDLVALQEKLLSEALPRKKFTGYSVARGSCLIEHRLHNKKVLIILDDVDDVCQLNALVGNCQWFGNGSRIIITTRDKHLLTSHGVDRDYMYKVEALENGAALELFRKHTFQGNQEIEISSNLIDRVLHYANGLPLALEVLGSSLCGRGEHEWKSTLQKLAKSPDKKINDVLKVSYYGLEDYAREIFLDIACFFKGQGTEYIKKVLDSRDFDMTIGVKILIERSLVSEENGTIQMHDLIQSMGMDIVKEECRDDPKKRSRLWLYDDVLDVLYGDLETAAVKAIVLELPKPKKMNIGPNAFTNMRKLRLLILRNVHNVFQGPIQLSNELRWFEWPNCASILEFSDGQKKLVGVNLQNANIGEVPKDLKGFKKLKFINFSECQSLVCAPNLDCTPNLEELDLSWCENLEHAHKSVECHRKLRLLNLRGCSKLLHVADVLRCKNLQHLDLACCSKLRRFPNIPDKIQGLQELNLDDTSIEELPASIENLVSLKEMYLKYCKKLSILPSSIYRLRNLEGLNLNGCSKLINFPKKEEDSSDPHMKMGFPKLSHLLLDECHLSEVEFLKNPSCFPSLSHLSLQGNNFTNLPTSKQLYKLGYLNVGQCYQLQEILEIPGQLHTIQAAGCKSLSKVPADIGLVDYINLDSCHELVSNGSAIYDLLMLEVRLSNGSAIYDLLMLEHLYPRNRCADVFLPGGEMPEWLLPNNDGYISFMASKDLFKKFLGVACCVVFRAKEGKEEEEDAEIRMIVSINHKCQWYRHKVSNSNLDHVWLDYWQISQEDAPDSNDWGCFQFSFQALARGIVKKCGFRLICKPQENDLELFLQHNRLLDPALLYEVWHEESQMSTVEESSSETKDLQDSKTSTDEDSSSKLVHKELNMADFPIEKFRYSLIPLDYQNVCPGGEMPEEFVLVEDGTISFMASENLYDKFLGLALCVIFGVEDGKKEVSFDIVPYINGQRRTVLSGTLGSFYSDHMWIQYLKPNVLWGVMTGGIDFGEFDERDLRFSLRLKVSGGTMKKLGYVIRCRQLEDDLKVVLENNQLVNLAALCEDSQDRYDRGENFPPGRHRFPREYLRKCHMHMEELEASDNETDQTGSGECSSETD